MEVTRSPYLIYPADVGLVIKEGKAFVDSFVWTNYTDPTHKVVIRDKDDRDVFLGRGTTDLGQVMTFPSLGGNRFDDMEVIQMDSGVLQIFIR